ncbi:hypothetical protein [Nostoc sp.]|uniref:hypothetical protein n=1 Tax=Nostoc sp. TaxID=1180 RepID=UPI002FF9BB5F
MKVDERVIASSSKCDRLSDSESQIIKAIAHIRRLMSVRSPHLASAIVYLIGRVKQ